MLLGLKNTIVAVLITASVGYVYSQYQFKQGVELGKASQVALQAQVDDNTRKIKEELALAVVEGLKQIQVKNVTINNKATKEVTKELVYTECKLPPAGLSIATEALRPRN